MKGKNRDRQHCGYQKKDFKHGKTTNLPSKYTQHQAFFKPKSATAQEAAAEELAIANLILNDTAMQQR